MLMKRKLNGLTLLILVCCETNGLPIVFRVFNFQTLDLIERQGTKWLSLRFQNQGGVGSPLNAVRMKRVTGVQRDFHIGQGNCRGTQKKSQ